MLIRLFYRLVVMLLMASSINVVDSYAGGVSHDAPIPDRHFVHFSPSDGLSNTWISDIYQCRNGFVWIATQYGLNRFDGVAFESFVYDSDDTTSLSSNWVKAISEDRDGDIWLAVFGKGLNKYDPVLETFSWHYGEESDPCYTKDVVSLLTDSLNQLWVGHRSGRELVIFKNEECLKRIGFSDRIKGGIVKGEWVVIYTDTSIRVFDVFSMDEVDIYQSDNTISAMVVAEDGLLFAEGKSIKSLNISTAGKIEGIQEIFISEVRANDIDIIDNLIYVGGLSGLYVYDVLTGQSKKYVHSAGKENSVVGGDILTLEVDRDNNLWIGGREGFCMMPDDYQSYEHEFSNTKLKEEKRVYAILPLPNGTYLGSEKGLLYFNMSVSSSREVIASGFRVRTLLESRDGFIYAGISSKASAFSSERILKVDPTSNTIVERYLPFFGRVDKPGRVLSIVEDQNGGIIAAIDNQLYFKNVSEDEFYNCTKLIPFDFSGVGLLLNIVLDQNGQLWIGTTQGGLIRVNWNKIEEGIQAADIAQYEYVKGEENSLCSNIIPYLFVDSRGLIWIATDGGINIYDPSTDTFDKITRSSGLISDKIVSITEDEFGQMWMGTISHGLLSISKDKDQFRFHREKNGIYNDAFLLQSVARDSSGVLYFGNEDGLQIFKPQPPLGSVDGLPKPILSRIYVNNREVRPNTSTILAKAPEYTSDISLGHKEKNITVSYAYPYFGLNGEYRYTYKLTGASNEWVTTNRLDEISFAQLTPGDYSLEVKVCVAQTCTISEPLKIKIHTAWWNSSLAWLLYSILLLSLALIFYRRRDQKRIETLQVEKRAAIQQAQSRFYTNMTHELRTPLTLISGPIQRLLSQSIYSDANSRALLNTVKSNSDHMLKLVNNLLDFSKIESGLMPVHNRTTELGPFLSTVIDAFRPEAISRDIQLIVELEVEGITALLDREKIRIILSNLLSNAIKFSQSKEHIHIDVEVKELSLLMSVSDSGIGMDSQEVEQLFDRFFRAETVSTFGSGVGMSLVKEVVELLDGTINVDSQKEKGTTVVVKCPITTLAPSENRKELIVSPDPHLKEAESKPIVLLIEDQPEVAAFVSSGLSESYRIISVGNGKQGCEVAMEKLPDLIISDVMMPGMDGYQVSRYLKSHHLTDHIPIVMLTARADQESRIKGMDAGVDAFLTKPFDDRELTLLLNNLLSTRDSILKKKIDLDSSGREKGHSPFLKRIEEHVLKLMRDDSLTVPALCKSLLVSRTQLHRKLKGETGMSTTQYLNKIKLSHATYLLTSTDLSIAEIVYQCGFNHPSYFSQVFLKNFHCTPGEYRLRAK